MHVIFMLIQPIFFPHILTTFPIHTTHTRAYIYAHACVHSCAHVPSGFSIKIFSPQKVPPGEDRKYIFSRLPPYDTRGKPFEKRGTRKRAMALRYFPGWLRVCQPVQRFRTLLRDAGVADP